jgi:hypothetical protein
LLSSPKVIKLLMVRLLATGVDATNDDVEKRTDNCSLENVARGVFWAPEDASAPGKRVLQGEVDVKKSFKPSTQFPKFTIGVRWFLLDTKTSFTIDIVIFDICSIIWNYNLSRHMVSSL